MSFFSPDDCFFDFVDLRAIGEPVACDGQLDHTFHHRKLGDMYILLARLQSSHGAVHRVPLHCGLMVCVAAAVLAGCQHDAPEMSGPPSAGATSIVLAPLSSEGCIASPNGDKGFPPGVETIVVDIRGESEFTTEIELNQVDTSGRVFIPGIPPGRDLTLSLYGCSAEGDLLWSGQYNGLDIEASEKSAPPLYFTRKGEMSCTGGQNAEGSGFSAELDGDLMLHTSVIAGTEIVIFGGFNQYNPTGAFPTLEATGTDVMRYDPYRGGFIRVGNGLTSPRAMAHAVVLDGGSHVLALGGVRRAEFRQSPPIDWDAAAAPAELVEIIDLEQGSVEPATWSVPNRPLSALAQNEDGTQFVILGGVSSDGSPTSAVEWFTGSAQAMLDGSITRVEGALSYQRMGATAHMLPESASALVIGGTVNSSPEAYAEIVTANAASIPVMLLDAEDGSFALHASEIVESVGCQHTLVVAGGVDLQRADPNPPVFLSSVASRPRFQVLLLDICDPSTPTARILDRANALLSDARAGRIFHQLTRLDAATVVLSGGYNQIGQPSSPVDPACDFDTVSTGCWLRDVSVLTLGGESSSPVVELFSEGLMSAARFGHRATRLTDGTVLFTGGMPEVSAIANNIANSAEIYNALLPGDAGRCSAAE